MAAYEKAAVGERLETGASRSKPGTVAALVASYYKTGDFTGLRKATCRRLAEAGCSAHEIMAISGHRSLAEVTRYTVAASRKDLAVRAMLALGRSDDETATVKPAKAV